jgi:hypothetical protein
MMTTTIRVLVSIVPPGVDEPSVRDAVPDRPYIKRIVSDLQTVNGVNSVTIHSMTKGDYQSVFLDCDVEHRGVGLFLGGSQYEQIEPELPDEVSSVAGGLAVRVAHHLPDLFGVEIVAYDPLLLGKAAVPTARLLAANEDIQSLRGKTTERPIADLLKYNATNRVPHLLGLEIDVASSTTTLPVTLRVATFGPRTCWSTPREFISFFENHHDIATRFESDAIHSTFQLPGIHGWDVCDAASETPASSYPVLWHEPSPDGPPVQHSLKPIRSPTEYYELLGIPTDSLDAVYRELGYEPQLPVPKAQLESLTNLPANYDVKNPWERCSDRDEPLLRTLYVLREATGTDQCLDDPPYPGRAASKRRLDIEFEDTPNARLAKTAVRYFRTQGEQLTLRPDTCAAIPFERHPTTGPASPVVVGSRETLSAGTVVAIAAAVTATDRPLTICVPSAADGQWITDVLCLPFSKTNGPWTALYSMPETPVWTDETIPVLPETAGPLTWLVHQDRTLALACNGRIIARGPISSPAAVLDGNVPEYRVATQELYNTDGSCVETDISADELSTRAQVFPWPAIMSRLCYLPATRVLENQQGTLVPTRVQASWDSSVARERNEAAATSFLSRLTQTQPGTTLPMAEVRPRFRSWVCHLTALHPPDPETAARYLHEASGNDSPAALSDPLPNRTWQYPVDLEPSTPTGLGLTEAIPVDRPQQPAAIAARIQTDNTS